MTLSGSEPRYEVARKGTALGTFALSEIAAGIASGTLAWTDDCWSEGMESWIKLSDIREQVESGASGASAGTAPSRTLTYLGFAAVALLSLGAGACFLFYSAPENGPSESLPPSPGDRSAASRSGLDKPSSLKLSETQAKITTLVATSFDVEKDPSGAITYAHRFYRGVGNRITLRVYVDSEGRCRLQTFHRGKNWIFHNQLKFVFGPEGAETSVIPAHRCAREIGDDNSVTEICRFEGPEDVKVIGKLAAASGTKISMQMVGRHPTEKLLSHETKQAIRDAHELSALLATRSKLLADLAAAP